MPTGGEEWPMQGVPRGANDSLGNLWQQDIFNYIKRLLQASHDELFTRS